MISNKIIKIAIVAPLMCLTMGVLASCASKVADLVVYSDIYTAENDSGKVTAFAVKDGRYIYVGTKEGAKAYIQEGRTEVIDRTDNGLVIPGCTEGHAHYFDGVGLNSQLPGSGETYENVLQILKKKFEEENIKQFVSFGWKTMSLRERRESGYDFASEIEQMAPGIPVILVDDSGHSAVANKTALAKAGISKDNPLVRGGSIYLTKEGEPSGYVGDQAVFYVTDKAISNLLSAEQYRNALSYGQNELLRFGYTNALDAFTNMYDPIGLYKAMKKMDEEKLLKINVAECFNMKSFDASRYQEVINDIVQINKNYSSKHCDASYIKLFADGVVESGTGWINGKYNNPVDGKIHGNIIWTPTELTDVVSYANKKGLTIHTHSFGDGACHATISAYIKSNEANDSEFRNCLAHVRNITNEDIIRAAINKISIAENLLWHTDYDDADPESKAIKDLIIGNIGEDYYYSGYPMKSLMDQGVIVSSSTDAPAAMYCEGNILNVIEIATTGKVPDTTGQAFAPEELISVEDALKALTINGAWQLGLENERGSIKEGKYADFLIIDTNFLGYTGEKCRTIHNAKILNTYFEGERVYSLK